MTNKTYKTVEIVGRSWRRNPDLTCDQVELKEVTEICLKADIDYSKTLHKLDRNKFIATLFGKYPHYHTTLQKYIN